ncbi:MULTISPECIES: LytR/AlgR family response regulator transcription factor [Arenibacter]|uniref:LytR/AlgR family response regulator transcription factor n=1 Tax=Arenibacter TaxID=178469 RepID=UPI00068E6846|nr:MULTISPECIES: LytTR family DNA-binding domain-containing protein [Arenibacter]GBF17850.1 transcriptional regulatory protein YpdB [Arenibacter sp. NBRC 103722]
MKINCLIIDDEPLAISILESYIKTLDYMTIVNSYTNAVDALSDIKEGSIDVIYLDINMSRINGLEFLRTLKNHPLIIITTAYREHALESYEFDVLDYLVKPIPFNRFVKSANRLVDRLKAKNENNGRPMLDNHVFVKVDKKMVRVVLNEILFIESLKDYIKIHTTTGSLVAYKSLSSIVEELPSVNFIRVHKSYAIAIDKVKTVDGNSIEIDNRSIPIGRIYLRKAKKFILSDNAISPKNFTFPKKDSL